MEGGHCIDGSLGALRCCTRLGARYLTLTHFREHPVGGQRHRRAAAVGGLSAFGREVVRE